MGVPWDENQDLVLPVDKSIDSVIGNSRDWIEWMDNKDHLECCSECPENKCYDGSHPCGHDNCWVNVIVEDMKFLRWLESDK